MVVTTKAIVLSTLKYGESDLIAHCFTETDGRKSYLLKRVLKSKRGALKPSQFIPLTQLEIVANHKNKGTLEYIKEAKVYSPYQSLHTNVVKSSLVMFLSEILKDTIQEEEKNSPLFQFLTASFNWLDSGDSYANFHILFLLKLTQYLGFYPDTSEGVSTYFNIMDGRLQNTYANQYCEEGAHVLIFQQFFGIKFEALSQINITKIERLEVLNLLMRYYQIHLQGFKKPKSLEILNQLFQ
ncbi:DNA repair protein RecO [Rasiella rasia]|uniref:DNA repair protein RecO n=1 Tax=Rasiella rasia TaxID=2744027 RepID=A0A6G6GNA4_9FLAO|nr:DNA repair protein RecO [Rasiella rasia]QIE60056.1 DNA repair protein RecO [Rasiella rasia]